MEREDWPLYPRPVVRRGKPNAWGARRAVPGSEPPIPNRLKDFAADFFAPASGKSTRKGGWTGSWGCTWLFFLGLAACLGVMADVWYPMVMVWVVLAVEAWASWFFRRDEPSPPGRRQSKRSP